MEGLGPLEEEGVEGDRKSKQSVRATFEARAAEAVLAPRRDMKVGYGHYRALGEEQ